MVPNDKVRTRRDLHLHETAGSVGFCGAAVGAAELLVTQWLLGQEGVVDGELLQLEGWHINVGPRRRIAHAIADRLTQPLSSRRGASFLRRTHDEHLSIAKGSMHTA